jgi:protein phosphatase
MKRYNYSSLSKIGFKRIENEDAIGIYEFDNGILFIVCDGLGGNKAGEIASQLTVNVIHNSFKNSSNDDPLERIKEAVFEANRIVLEKATSDSELKGMATTAEVLFLNETNVYWGHVGDSRIYNFQSGKLKQLTKDHSLIQKLIDEGHLTLKEAENHPNKNIIMRAVGDREDIKMDLSKMRLNSKDDSKFFICTDGVTAVINDIELEKIMKYDDLKAIEENLTGLIEDRGAPDNFSFIIIEKSIK